MKTRKKLWIFLLSLFCLVLGGCGAQEGETEAEAPGVSWESLSFPQELEILYATQFSAASSPEGYTKISIEDGLSYLVVPEGAAVPSGVPAEITVIQQPLDHIYLAATSAMDLFRALEAIDRVTLSGVEADGWYIPEAKEAMEQEGQATATIVWSSANYDYMKVDGVQYDPVNTEGNAAFTIPVAGFDWKLPVLANTTAMSTPHEIEYTLTFDSVTLERVE